VGELLTPAALAGLQYHGSLPRFDQSEGFHQPVAHIGDAFVGLPNLPERHVIQQQASGMSIPREAGEAFTHARLTEQAEQLT